MSKDLTRRGFLKAVGAGAALVALTTTPGCESLGQRSQKDAGARTGQPAGGVMSLRSRPDLKPPVIEVRTPARDTAPGYVFAAPKKSEVQEGVMILDNTGQPVWFRPQSETALDFKAQQYRGEPVLTWWTGVVHHGAKRRRTEDGLPSPVLGEYVILDANYREVTRVRAGNRYQGDHHEFLISPDDTALLIVYHPVRRDLSSVGGAEDGIAVDGIIQEVDIETGDVLFEWHSLDHIALDESDFKVPENARQAYDYFHLNSIDVDADGNLLISARVTNAAYKIDRQTGEVMWRLGGNRSDFEMGPGTETRYQHDARRQPDGTITIFDNAVPGESRGIVLEVDEEAMTAELAREYYHPDEMVARALGNMQALPNGNVFIGWGSEPNFSEYGRDGEMLFDAVFPGEVESYRSFRFPWSGQPDEDPAVAAERGSDDEVTLYASWNGATEVAEWRALAGPSPEDLKPVGSAPRDGFETAVTASTAEPYVAVQARDGSGMVLGASEAVKPGT